MKKIFVLIVPISLVLNLILILYVYNSSFTVTPDYTPPPVQYGYLSPRIFMENQNDIIVNFVPLREKLRQYVEDLPNFGIYFEYLPSGVSAGVNEKKSYVLASLLKTPMVMAVYRQIETDNWDKSDVLTVEKSDLDPFFGDLYKKGAGTKLTLEEAIGLTLIKSDNTAKSVLFSHLPNGALDKVFDYLDIPKDLDGLLPVVTPKNYSSILRSLYLSSYLEKQSSNEILTLMTQSSFNDKLTAPIPGDIKVAHKIGVYEKDNEDKSVFTDCGIVFLPKRPYILCLMDRDTEKNAQRHMFDVSKLVFDYVSNASP